MEKNIDFIPRSARINFELYVRPTIKQSTDFTSIQSETTDLIKSFQLNIKSQIMKTMRLDISHLKNEIDNIVCQLIFYMSKAFYLQFNPKVATPSTIYIPLLRCYPPILPTSPVPGIHMREIWCNFHNLLRHKITLLVEESISPLPQNSLTSSVKL